MEIAQTMVFPVDKGYEKPKFIDYKEMNKKQSLKAKTKKFNSENVKCPEFEWKPGELKCYTAWCKLLNSSCRFKVCPKLK